MRPVWQQVAELEPSNVEGLSGWLALRVRTRIDPIGQPDPGGEVDDQIREQT
jgi:hypothetical protein